MIPHLVSLQIVSKQKWWWEAGAFLERREPLCHCSLSLYRNVIVAYCTLSSGPITFTILSCSETHGTWRSFQDRLKVLEKSIRHNNSLRSCFFFKSLSTIWNSRKPLRCTRSQETCALTSAIQIVRVHEWESFVAVRALLRVALVHRVHHHSHLLPGAAHCLLPLLG